MSTPSTQQFVVEPKSGSLPDGLEGKPAGARGLFVVPSPVPADDARQGWERLIQQHGQTLAFVAPVMVDPQGRESFPTGTIIVQFQQAPSGEALDQFADSHGLRFLRKSEFRPNQLTFEPAGDQPAYLPDLVAKLQTDPNIRLAAPETLAGYKRI